MDFPFPLPPLDLAAPFDRHRATVLPAWIDANGHMNVGYYSVAFDQATDTFCDQLGVGWSYVEHGLGMVFALESHLTFDREVRAGDPLRVTTQILDHDAKRVQFIHAMYHAEAGWLAATNELILMHIDPQTPRSAPWRAATQNRLVAMAAAHRALARPAQAGRSIALRKKRD